MTHGREAPGEALGEGGRGGGLGSPVVVGVISVERVVKGRLRHEGVELSTEATSRSGSHGSLAEVAGGVDQVSLPLPPFGPAVLEPNLEESKEEDCIATVLKIVLHDIISRLDGYLHFIATARSNYGR